MTDAACLERAYRRWLRWYPRAFRREHEAEILGVLMAGARDGQRRPGLLECLDLAGSALRVRLRPRVPRSDRTAFTVVRLMYLGAVVELATAITIIATMGEVTANVVRRNPALTAVEWHATVVGQLVPKAAAAGVAVGFWLWMAWAVGRGRRGPRIAFATFFGLNTFSLLDGLAKGSAVYAVTDLAFGLGLWLIELAALVAIFRRADGRVWIRRA